MECASPPLPTDAFDSIPDVGLRATRENQLLLPCHQAAAAGKPISLAKVRNRKTRTFAVVHESLFDLSSFRSS